MKFFSTSSCCDFYFYSDIVITARCLSFTAINLIDKGVSSNNSFKSRISRSFGKPTKKTIFMGDGSSQPNPNNRSNSPHVSGGRKVALCVDDICGFLPLEEWFPRGFSYRKRHGLLKILKWTLCISRKFHQKWAVGEYYLITFSSMMFLQNFQKFPSSFDTRLWNWSLHALVIPSKVGTNPYHCNRIQKHCCNIVPLGESTIQCPQVV